MNVNELVIEQIARDGEEPVWRILGAGIEDTVAFADRDRAEKIAKRLAVCARSEGAWSYALERLCRDGARNLVPRDVCDHVERASGMTTWPRSHVSARIRALVLLALYRGERGLDRLAF